MLIDFTDSSVQACGGGGGVGLGTDLLELTINNHQAEIAGIDQPQIKRWLKLSDADTADWRLCLTKYILVKAIKMSSVCEWASGTALEVN